MKMSNEMSALQYYLTSNDIQISVDDFCVFISLANSDGSYDEYHFKKVGAATCIGTAHDKV